MAVELVEIVNPNGRKGFVAATSTAAEVYKQPPSARPDSEANTEPASEPTDANDPAQEPVDDQPAPPAGNASTDAWATYARSLGATDADLLNEDGEPLGRDALREKYSAPHDPASTTSTSTHMPAADGDQDPNNSDKPSQED